MKKQILWYSHILGRLGLFNSLNSQTTFPNPLVFYHPSHMTHPAAIPDFPKASGHGVPQKLLINSYIHEKTEKAEKRKKPRESVGKLFYTLDIFNLVTCFIIN